MNATKNKITIEIRILFIMYFDTVILLILVSCGHYIRKYARNIVLGTFSHIMTVNTNICPAIKHCRANR